MSKSYLSFLFTIMFTTFGCVSTFEPDVTKYEELLVVDGFISDEDAEYKVLLSISKNDNSQYTEYISDADVRIYDEDGNYTILTQKQTNAYETNKNHFRGEVGKKYKLYIKALGKEYESELTLMQKTPEIGELSYDIFHERYNTGDIGGVNISIKASRQVDEASFLFWEFEDAWSFFIQQSHFFSKTCYQFEKYKPFSVGSLIDKKNNILEKIIHRVDNSGYRLSQDYQIKIRQYGIDEKTYLFYKSQIEQKENVGSMYDKTPIMIKGNIRCISEPNEPVLGYFRVASVETNVLKINTSIFENFNTLRYQLCRCFFEINPFNHRMIRYFISLNDSGVLKCPIGPLIPVGDTLYFNNDTIGLFTFNIDCYRCNNHDASPTPPDFWIENQKK